MMIWENCIPSQIHLTVENVYEGCNNDRIHKLRRAIANMDDPSAPWFTEDELAETYEGMFGCTAPCDLSLQLFVARRSEVYHDRDCTPEFPTGFSQKLPFIARVNREARDAAHSYVCQHITCRHNLAFVHTNTRPEIDRVRESPVWLNLDTDTVLINTQYIHAHNHPPMQYSGMVEL